MARVTGQRVRSLSPAGDTPDAPPRDAAQAAWRFVTPSIAGAPHIRTSADRGRTFPARRARPLPGEAPNQPATVPVYDAGSASGRLLALDLDLARGDVDRQADEIARLLERLGARYIADVSPSGGRHVLVPFAAALPWRELRDLCRAIARRFGAVDPAPMASLSGQIAPPGSRHKSGGWRVLSVLLSEAVAAVEHPNGPQVWAALLDEFAAELQQVETEDTVPPVLASAMELDDSGAPWVPRLGGRANLSPELARTARTGRWDRTRYADRSAARMALLTAAAARGWRLADVRAAVGSGAWEGLPGLYHRASEPGRMERLLPYEWRKCVGKISGEKNVCHWHTSALSTRPPADASTTSAEYGLIRQWLTATLCAAEDRERVKGWGRRAIAVRLVLLALGQAAMVSESSVVEFGTRNLALHSALSHRTVSRVLRILRDEPDPLIDLVSIRKLARADRYALRIPDRYADSVRWRRRRAGRVEAAHPAFLVLGGTAALAYEALGPEAARGAEVARAARLSASAVSTALRVLAEHGLAERGPGGWRRGPVALADVAESTGAADLQREREARYKRDRASWRARLRMYVSARSAVVAPRDGWWPLDDQDEYEALLFSRWPVLGEDFVRGPPSAAARESA